MTTRRRHAVIVDDERLARRELRKLLEKHHAATVHIVGEAATLHEARRIVEATDADLVFLDITLGRESGFDLLSSLGPDVAMVFVTAHDAFAIRAFEVNALDYLLKPVEIARLARTIARLDTRPEGGPQETPAAPLSGDDRLFLRLDGRRAFVRIGDIVALEADGDDSLLHLLRTAAPARTGKPLGAWETRLPPRTFLRVHRSTIINLEQVLRVEEWSHGSYLVYLRDVPAPLPMSRRYARELRGRLG